MLKLFNDDIGDRAFEKKAEALLRKASEGNDFSMAAVYGSQKYGLSDEMSDIDLLAIRAPTAESMLTDIPPKVLSIDGNHVFVANFRDIYGAAQKGDIKLICPFANPHSAIWRIGGSDMDDAMAKLWEAFDDYLDRNRRRVADWIVSEMRSDQVRMSHPSEGRGDSFALVGYDSKSSSLAIRRSMAVEAIASGLSMGNATYFENDSRIALYHKLHRAAASKEEAYAAVASAVDSAEKTASAIPNGPDDGSSLLKALSLVASICRFVH